MNRKALVKTLEVLKPGLSSNSIVEQSDHFIFANNKIYAYNDEILVSVPYEADGLSFCVPADLLLDLLNKMEEETIKLIRKDGKLIVKGKNKRATILTQEEILLPIDKLKLPKKWEQIDQPILDAIDLCTDSTSSDNSDLIFTAIHIAETFIEATDTFQMTKVTIPERSGKSVLIPSASAAHLKNYKFTHMAVKKGWVIFKEKKRKINFFCRTITGQFPSKILNRSIEGIQKDHQIIKLPKEIQTMIERGVIFVKSNDDKNIPFISISINKKKLTIKSLGVQGKYWEEKQIKYKGPSIDEMRVDPQFLLKALSFSNKVKWNKDEEQPAYLFEFDNIQHLLAGVRKI